MCPTQLANVHDQLGKLCKIDAYFKFVTVTYFRIDEQMKYSRDHTTHRIVKRAHFI